MEKTLDGYCTVLRWAIGLLVGALIVPVAMQVVSRYSALLPNYLWTEELATYLFVWIVMLGSAVAVWEGTHFDVRVIPDFEGPLGRFVQNAVPLLFIITLAVLFAWFGMGYAEYGSRQTSTMMQVNMLVIYITVPITGVHWTVFAAFRLWQELQRYRGIVQ